MKSRIWLGLLLALSTGHAWGATNSGQSVVFIPGVQSGPCSTWPSCPAVPNDATHVWYFAPGTGATFAVTGTFWQTTQPISAVSLPLPTNAAQETGGNLATIVTNTTGLATATNQASVQSAPGTPQTKAITIQGNPSAIPVGTVLNPTSASTSALATVVSSSLESSHVLKPSAGNFYSTIVTATAAGYLMVFNAVVAPADGVVTPVFCIPVQANTAQSLTSAPIPTAFSSGITVVYSTTGCFTKTASATAMFTGEVQ